MRVVGVFGIIFEVSILIDLFIINYIIDMYCLFGVVFYCRYCLYELWLGMDVIMCLLCLVIGYELLFFE